MVEDLASRLGIMVVRVNVKEFGFGIGLVCEPINCYSCFRTGWRAGGQICPGLRTGPNLKYQMLNWTRLQSEATLREPGLGHKRHRASSRYALLRKKRAMKVKIRRDLHRCCADDKLFSYIQILQTSNVNCRWSPPLPAPAGTLV